ncbi:MAG: vitamin B12-dependent ribonucleotide reductase [Chloroflexota bacterium]|nr:vitamin B12-dependent ribonucleotide reductase [Chloroflexota bacterium]
MAQAAKTRRVQVQDALVRRFFTRPGVDPFDEVEWERRTALIEGKGGRPVFVQEDVEFPKAWSQQATNIVASKYFRGPLGTPQRERSVRQLISRVVDTIAGWGQKGGYFSSQEEMEAFREELKFLLLHQYACFNSPVWFNVGIEERPQCSACFILSIEDSMESILDWYKTEGKIFKGGSGAGINLSPLRSSRERLSSGGIASGPVSFMRGADAIAGTIKSGGKTRRAAKMVVLNVDHPDIEEFIWCKAKEERKARALVQSGWDPSLDSELWISIQYQNANNSVRVTDEFMRAVLEDREWQTRYVTTGEVSGTYRARDLLRQMAQAAWECADPGIQYDTTINDWHTCPNSGRINASNPCSEYMHLDDSACNLASLNLLKFLREDDTFDIEAFKQAVAVMITAQEIIVDNSSYPTEKIERNARDYRQLGLGYSNLGALLMTLGLPYDSEEGRAYAAALTALLTGHAYAVSARIAARMGPFAGYLPNRDPMLGVIGKHREHAYRIYELGRYGRLAGVPEAGEPAWAERVPGLRDLVAAAQAAWDEALALGEEHGYRNAQVSVIAPTGTISFMMDCDTTGIEPELALVKYKALVGGGVMRLVNRAVPRALRRLGYSPEQIEEIMAFVDSRGTIEGAPHLREEHLPVFDCAFKAPGGQRSIHWMGHIRMMGAVQPFISGAISKTVNLPEDATVEDVEQAFIEGWRHGLKALSIYRDNSKNVQVLFTRKEDVEGAGEEPRPVRRRLPDTRRSLTHKFSIEGHEGYITVGLYEDGSPGEIFITMAKEGSTLSGTMDAFATAISLALQYGVPLRDLVYKFSHMRFEPSGRTENPEIPVAQSIVDYIFRWLASQFLSEEEKEELGVLSPAVREKLVREGPKQLALPVEAPSRPRLGDDAPPCPACGWIMARRGACYSCDNCGTTTGCG